MTRERVEQSRIFWKQFAEAYRKQKPPKTRSNTHHGEKRKDTMPNWCMNSLTIEHDDVEKVNEFVAAYKRGETCEHYLPTPKRDDGELSDDWWDYRMNNWGTKWDFGSYEDESGGLHPTVVDNQATMGFDSAWSPPFGLYQRLAELGFKVKASYFEPGVGFAGRWIDGDDQYYEGGREAFPQDLQEEYDMDEFYEN